MVDCSLLSCRWFIGMGSSESRVMGGGIGTPRLTSSEVHRSSPVHPSAAKQMSAARVKGVPCHKRLEAAVFKAVQFHQCS